MRALTELQPETSENVDINLSPLIDMVFLLLIFFMVTTAFVKETGVEVNKPKAASADELEQTSILLAVTKDGRIMHAGRQIDLQNVRALVSRLKQTQGRRPVIIQTDTAAMAGTVVQVIDQCRLAGVPEVSVATCREKKRRKTF